MTLNTLTTVVSGPTATKDFTKQRLDTRITFMEDFLLRKNVVPITHSDLLGA
jgi:hypothetical protein